MNTSNASFTLPEKVVLSDRAKSSGDNKTVDTRIQGVGSIILHAVRIDADISLRLSDLLRRLDDMDSQILSLQNRMEALE